MARVALRMRSMWYVVWAAMANLMILHRTRNRKLPQAYSVTNNMGRILLDRYPHMKLASRASRPGLTVGFLRILCNGLRTGQRFHIEGEEETCRVGMSR